MAIEPQRAYVEWTLMVASIVVIAIGLVLAIGAFAALLQVPQISAQAMAPTDRA